MNLNKIIGHDLHAILRGTYLKDLEASFEGEGLLQRSDPTKMKLPLNVTKMSSLD